MSVHRDILRPKACFRLLQDFSKIKIREKSALRPTYLYRFKPDFRSQHHQDTLYASRVPKGFDPDDRASPFGGKLALFRA